MGKVHIYREFNTYKEAREFMLRTLKLFDPLAYDTNLSMCRNEERYVVRGQRYASAD